MPHLTFPGVRLAITPEYMHIESTQPLHILSSAVVGGGYVTARHIINRHVDKNYHRDDAVADQVAFARAQGIDEPFVGLLTAVYLEKLRVSLQQHDELLVTALVTAGVGNATAAGVTAPASPRPGTINIILLVDGNLAPPAMVNAVITATEAKTHVLLERGVHTADGRAATGTSTDAIAVACTGRGPTLAYAGPATVAGSLIGQAVRRCLQEAVL